MGRKRGLVHGLIAAILACAACSGPMSGQQPIPTGDDVIVGVPLAATGGLSQEGAQGAATLGKTVSNVQEVRAREAPVIAVITEGENPFDTDLARDVVEVPGCEELLSPLVTVVPLQLFAYHIAVQRGCDVDQPRNLAKSVTVE